MALYYRTFMLFALCFTTFTVYAQKQPQVQEVSVLAPAGVKIDGKLNEWQNPFINPQKYNGFLSAFNSSSRIYYTMANDDKNLYLVVRGLGNGVSKKIMAGGLVLTISHEKKNRTKDANNIALGFPIPIDAKTNSFIMTAINQIMDFTDDSVANRKPIDSLDSIANKIVSDATREIKVAGIKEISDSVISIYNTQGIKAAIRFIQVQPVIEIAIPLKYLGLSIDNPVAFSYNIRINAVPLASRMVPDPNAPVQTVVGGQLTTVESVSAMPINPNIGYAWNPTDFWGEYVLTKK